MLIRVWGWIALMLRRGPRFLAQEGDIDFFIKECHKATAHIEVASD